MHLLLFDITQGKDDLVPFLLAALGILVIGAIAVVLLLKFLKKISK
jgi:hypothetical protein